MIRIFLGPRFLKALERLNPDQKQKAQDALAAVMEGFGQAHRHSGLALRKIGPVYFECRIDLHWRIVLQERRGNLIAYDIMTHNEIPALIGTPART
jgi:hypothetical protein